MTWFILKCRVKLVTECFRQKLNVNYGYVQLIIKTDDSILVTPTSIPKLKAQLKCNQQNKLNMYYDLAESVEKVGSIGCEI